MTGKIPVNLFLFANSRLLPRLESGAAFNHYVNFLPTNGDFAKISGHRDPHILGGFLRLAFHALFEMAVTYWHGKKRSSDEYKQAAALLRLRGMTPEQAILNGLGSATCFTLDTAGVLAEKTQLLHLDPATINQIYQEHARFMLRVSNFGLNSFARFSDYFRTSPLPALVEALCGTLGHPELQTVFRKLETITGKGDSNYFEIKYKPTEGGGFLPILDFRLDKIKPDDRDVLAKVGVIYGCPAGPINVEFIPLLCQIFVDFVVTPSRGAS